MNNIKEKTSLFVYRYAFICFCCGLCADMIAYLVSRNYLLSMLNVGAIGLISLISFCHFRKKMPGKTALTYLLCVMQCNIVGTMISRALYPTEYQAYGLLLDLVTALVVCVLATISQRRNFVIGMCLAAMVPFALIAILDSEQPMLGSLPSLCAIFMMPIGMASYVVARMEQTYYTNEVLTIHQQRLRDFLQMDSKQWAVAMEVIGQHNAPLPQMQRTFRQLGALLNEQLVLQAKKMVFNDHVLIATMERHCINLTKRELELCRLILEGKTIEEIGITLRLSSAAVRTGRSRLRKKLGMNTEEDLKVHLLSLVEQKDMD